MRATNHISDERKGWRKRFRGPRSERGVALLMAIFGLLLLTAIAAAMLFSTNTETTIAVNYRDKQAATYAAISGLQEARDRLHPLYGDLSGFKTPGTGPIDLPDLTSRNVLYIVNPDPSLGETAASIAPWSQLDKNGNPNPYFDTELCQENYSVLNAGKTYAVGAPCKTIPAGNCTLVGAGGPQWCQYHDNSAPDPVWGSPHPLPYKWVRITLKADNSGPVWVQTPGSPANGTQVCFGTGPGQQIQRPLTANTECLGAKTFSVSAVSPNTYGAGYSSPPPVSFIGGGGSGAAATANLTTSTGGIDLATLTNKGSGYTSKPNITITNPDGSGAAFAALISGSPVTGLTPASNNYCYQQGAAGLVVSFDPTPPPTIGGSATTNVNMTGGVKCISGWTATTTCNPLKDTPVTVSSVPGATGSGFSGTVNIGHNGKVNTSPSIQDVGSYTSVPSGSVPINIGHGCTLNATFTGGIQIQNIDVTNGGEYATKPNATISGQAPSAPSSSQPTLNVQWTAGPNNGQLSGINVTNTGSGYANTTPDHYTLAFSGGGGSGATGNATSTGVTTYVSSFTVTNGGSGYTSPPQVVIGGPGSGATATAFLGKPQQLDLGAVYMLTSLARTPSGSTAMAQMEAGVMPPIRFQLGGALTLDYPNPTFGSPNSNNFKIDGNDASASGGTHPAGCDTTAGNARPAIGVYDQNAVDTVVGGLGKPNNYIGAQSAPDVIVTSAADPDAQQLDQEVDSIRKQPGTQVIPGPATSIPLGSPTNIQYIVVDGDLTLSGNPSGYGVLVVTGNLTLSGNFTWHGVVLVLGTAVVNNDGGGNGQIVGAMYVGGYSCTTPTSCTKGSSAFNWNGGGGNGIQYDHCWADYLLNQFPPNISDRPLQVLSTRMLEF